MKKSKTKKCLLIFSLFLSAIVVSNAQWYKLGNYINPYISDSSDYWMGGRGSYPYSPIVAGNGVIAYEGDAQWLFGNEQQGVIEQSVNDLNTCTNIYGGITEPGTLGRLASKNKTTYCYINILGLSGDYAFFYTSDNFSTAVAISPLYIVTLPTVMPICLSTNLIYAAGYDSYNDTLVIYRAYTSPDTIKRYYNAKYQNPLQLYFTSDSVGFMICSYSTNSSKSVLARTADSGAIWTDCFLDSLHSITACSFPSDTVGYLTENNGNIYKTYNNGLTWVKLNSPTTTPLYCVSFSNNLLGYVAGSKGVLYKTINGGANWTTEVSGDTNSINSLYTFDTVAYFIDSNLNIYKNESPMGIENLENTTSLIKIYPNPGSGIFNLVIASPTGTWQSPANIEIYNMLGEKIYSNPFQISNSPFQINLNGQPNGVYLYRVISQNGDLLGEGKLVKE